MKPIGIGQFDKRGNACLKFNLHGVKHNPPGPEFTGIIDTGFTGFIQLPIQCALALSLPLEGTNSVTFANGSTSTVLTALAKATLVEKTVTGVVLLSFTSEDILLVSEKIGVVLMQEKDFSSRAQAR